MRTGASTARYATPPSARHRRWRTRYTSTNDTPTDYLYTGQRLEVEIGLYYYVARWYDPVLAHFTQADGMIANPSLNLAWNRYSYVDYNPVIYSDPSGHMRSNEDSYYKGSTGNTSAAITWRVIVNTQKKLLGKYSNVKVKGYNGNDSTTYRALYRITNALEMSYKTHGNSDEGFTQALGKFTISNGSGEAWTNPFTGTITFPAEALTSGGNQSLYDMVHEFGHEYDFQRAGRSWIYKSQTFVDVFSPGCDVGRAGCLGADPRKVYENLNLSTGGSSAHGQYNVNTHTTDYAISMGSIDDWAESYANYVFSEQGVSGVIPIWNRIPNFQGSIREFMIATWVELTK